MKKHHAVEILVGIIITVVGGLILAWLLGEGRFAKPSHIPQTITTFPTASTTPTSVISDIPATVIIEPTPTPRGIRNPTSPVAAGTPILVDDFSLTLEDSITVGYADSIGIRMILQNVGGKERLFRYQRIGISVEDNLGNSYLSGYDTLVGNFEDELYDTQQLNVIPGDTVLFESDSIWQQPNDLQFFIGPVALQASQLIIKLQSFGPYDGIEIVIDL